MISSATKWQQLAVTGIILTSMSGPAYAQMVIPSDVQDTCSVPDKTFNSWFDSGSTTLNGSVKPADSRAFPTVHTICDFYQWGEQMFLWLVSPEGDGLVLNGGSIFSVSPADAQGNRNLVVNPGSTGVKTAVRSQKTDYVGEIKQAGGGGVLMSQGKSLIYYGLHVNAVYAYFLTGQKGGSFPDTTNFPRNSKDVNALEAYMKAAFPGVALDDPESMAIEIKTSWVDASTLADSSKYVTMDATVPGYKPNADNTKWTPTDTDIPMKLALVGMHIVGTVQNHPEFVWATFEHVSNAPDGRYWYTDSKGNAVEQAYDSSGDFLFMPSGGSQTNANLECMAEVTDGSIVANLNASKTAPECGGGIVPSSTYRAFPWGNPEGGESDAIVENNTLLLSVNNSVISQLSAGDVRKNYVQIGAIWSHAPGPTDDAPIPAQDPDFSFFDMRGSLTLSNASMETYHQGSTCFDCHSLSKGAKSSFEAFELLHIYSQIVPLPLPGK